MVEEKNFSVHKLVLAVQSLVFDELFMHSEDLKAFEVVTNFSVKSFEDILRYFYYDEMIQCGSNAIELF